jgi:acyl-CoA reductase-like NAD-dependent aldehyde dehydrogenase
LWEYAVITYLPHDLDISDSLGLVKNPLFPYLLREGMMQMMIVESMEAPSFNECSSASFHRKTSKSFSDATTSSDATIPTAPSAPWRNLSQEEMARHLERTIQHLDKFQKEKDMRTVSEDSSTVVDNIGGVKKEISTNTKVNTSSRRHHHRYDRTSGKSSSAHSRSQETFAC